MPRFSVVVPAYNASATLSETLDAMLAQELSDWECVVVDDGSTDETAVIADDYRKRDKRFRLIRQENKGTAGAYKTGLAVAAADLLVICSADDLLLPGHLCAMDAFIRENPQNEIYSSNGEYLYHESVRRTVYTKPEWRQERSLSFEQVVAECFFSVGVVFRRRVLEMTGGHRLGVYGEDYDLWLRAMVRGARHRYTPQVLSVHRVSSFQLSANLVRVLESNIEVYEHLLADSSAPPAHQAAIEESIVRNRALIEDLPVVQALDRQARSLRLRVERVVGARHIESAMRAIRAVSWVAKPFRRIVAKLSLH